ncbi:MAG: hypothetical protein H6R31_532 [Methanomicrobia archaeon]|nr:hypothetical protein [Methanomicrobia archaeon]
MISELEALLTMLDKGFINPQRLLEFLSKTITLPSFPSWMDPNL